MNFLLKNERKWNNFRFRFVRELFLLAFFVPTVQTFDFRLLHKICLKHTGIYVIYYVIIYIM